VIILEKNSLQCSLACLSKARQLFDTDEAELEYLEDLDLDDTRANVLQSLGRQAEAADLHLSEGRPMVAIPLLLEEPWNEQLARQAADVIVQELWRNISISIGKSIDQQTVSQLLQWSASIDKDFLKAGQTQEVC
jgi:hypothetical protein